MIVTLCATGTCSACDRHRKALAALDMAGKLALHARWLDGQESGIRLNLAGMDLHDIDLHDAILTGAILTGAILTGATLTCANMTGAILTGATLWSANMTGAILTGATLTGATLTGANMTGATLRSADLTRANMTGATLTAAVGLPFPILFVGPIGSRNDTLCYRPDIDRAATGCYPKAEAGETGTLNEFAARVAAVHGESRHGRAYRDAIAYLRTVRAAYVARIGEQAGADALAVTLS